MICRPALQSGCALATDRHECFNGGLLRFAMAAQPLQTLSQCLLYGVRDGLTGLLGNGLCKLISFGVFYAQSRHLLGRQEIALLIVTPALNPGNNQAL